MRKVLFLFLTIALLLLCSCSSPNDSVEDPDEYGKGFQDGYDEGYLRGIRDTESKYLRDSSPGDLSDHAIDIIKNASADAERFAMEKTEYDAETAMMIVHSYMNSEPGAFGEMHTYDEFQEAVLTLYEFYAYFYGAEYE